MWTYVFGKTFVENKIFNIQRILNGNRIPCCSIHSPKINGKHFQRISFNGGFNFDDLLTFSNRLCKFRCNHKSIAQLNIRSWCSFKMCPVIFRSKCLVGMRLNSNLHNKHQRHEEWPKEEKKEPKTHEAMRHSDERRSGHSIFSILFSSNFFLSSNSTNDRWIQFYKIIYY